MVVAATENSTICRNNCIWKRQLKKAFRKTKAKQVADLEAVDNLVDPRLGVGEYLTSLKLPNTHIIVSEK